jgi:hypothetical protein
MEANETTLSMSLPTRLLKVFFSPGEVFSTLREKPAWFGAAAVSGVLVVLSMILIPTDIWVESMREQAVRQGTEMPSFMASAGPFFRLASAVSGLIGIFLWVFILTGIVTVFFSFLFGDEGRYKQYLSVVSHALIITAVGSLLLIPLRILQGDPTLTLNVGTFLPFLEEGYAFRVLKLLDLFGLWGYSVMAVGVTKVDPRRGMGVALFFFLAFAVASALVFGIFGG